MKGWKRIFQGSGNPKEVGVARLISDKIDFRTKIIMRERRSLCNVKGSIHQKDETMVNIYILTLEHLAILN